jgi:hypothetical protein
MNIKSHLSLLLAWLLLPVLGFSNNPDKKPGALLADTIPPVAYCLTGIITVPIPPSGCITIWAKDLDLASVDNITARNNLKFYFDGDRNQVSKTICCDDFVAVNANDELSVIVQMWVEDESGNTDYCTTTLIIQDNLDVCPNKVDAPFYIKGSIHSVKNEFVNASIKITLDGPNGFHAESPDGQIQFSNLDSGTYTLCLESNNYDFLNGVSTADIVKIQRHILGIESIQSPYNLLSADVNASRSLTAADISEIRKLILGIKARLKVPNWIFIPDDYVFDPNVFPDVNKFIPSCYTIEIIDKSLDNVNFTGIKMGDIR